MSTKDKIMTEACALLLSAGYTHFSMRKLAKAVGISATAIYRHYEDKDALLCHVIDFGFREFLGCLEPDPNNPRDFMGLLEAYQEFALSQPELYRLIFMTPDDVNFLAAPPELLEASQKSFLVLLRGISDERARQKLPPLEENALFDRGLTVWGQLHGVMSLIVFGRITNSTNEMFDEVSQSCLRTALA